MKFTLLDLYCFSIGIAAIIGVARFNKIHPAYYPFLFLTWTAFATEITSYFLIYSGHYNAVPYNIYVLCEAILVLFLFKKWGLFTNLKPVFYGLLVFLVALWFIDCFYIKGIKRTITYYRIAHSFIIVMMSIAVISKLITSEKEPLLKNSTFLICLGFTLFFTFKVFVGIFTLWAADDKKFRMSIGYIPVYLNVFTNLIYALAVLWMPARLRFTMPSS